MRQDSPISYFLNYLRRGASYIAVLIGIINFALLGYDVIMVQLLGYPSTIDLLLEFGIMATSAVMVLIVIIGRWDYRRGTASLEHELFWIINPVWIDMMRAFKAHSENDEATARAIYQKWIERSEEYTGRKNT